MDVLLTIVLFLYLSGGIAAVVIFLYATCLSLRGARLGHNSLPAERIVPLDEIITPSSVIVLRPAFAFGPVKGTEPRECSVCLSLLAGGARVRMLPNCKHVFHAECIDMWLSSHPTCPVCRSPMRLAGGEGSGGG